MNKNFWIVIVLVVLIIAGIVYAQNNNRDSQNSTLNESQQSNSSLENETQTTPAAQEQNMNAPTAGSNAQNIKAFTITGGTFSGSNYSYSPNEIRVKKGDQVKITFMSQGGIHDLVINDFNVKTNQLQSGQQETINFTADKTGTFEFYCSVGNHRAMGMVGKLIVE